LFAFRSSCRNLFFPEPGGLHPDLSQPIAGSTAHMPGTRASVKNEKQYEGLRKKGMSKERAAKIANSPGASSRGGKKSRSKSS
jgi:hypothetical protein